MPHPLNPDVPTLVDLQAEIERLRGQVAALELTGDRAELQSLLDQCGLDFERMRAENAKLRATLQKTQHFVMREGDPSDDLELLKEIDRTLEEGAQ